MTDIEQRARDALNEVCIERKLKSAWLQEDGRSKHLVVEVVCRMLEREDALQERFDAYRQEVSDKVEYVLAARGVGTWQRAKDRLASLIIPKPDLLQESLSEALCGVPDEDYSKESDAFLDALAKRGGKIVWEGDDAS